MLAEGVYCVECLWSLGFVSKHLGTGSNVMYKAIGPAI